MLHRKNRLYKCFATEYFLDKIVWSISTIIHTINDKVSLINIPVTHQDRKLQNMIEIITNAGKHHLSSVYKGDLIRLMQQRSCLVKPVSCFVVSFVQSHEISLTSVTWGMWFCHLRSLSLLFSHQACYKPLGTTALLWPCILSVT